MIGFRNTKKATDAPPPAGFEDDVDAHDDGTHEIPEALRKDEFEPSAAVTVTDDTAEEAEKRVIEDKRLQDDQLLQGDDGKRIIPLIAINDDVNRIPGQNYACVSVIKPELYDTLHHGERKYRGMLFKIRGIFSTREEADDWIRNKIMNLDPHFDVHLIKCHSWSGLEDDRPQDNEYMDKKIQGMMSAYFEDEHDKMLGIQARVQMAERKTERTKEAGDFYRDSVASAKGEQVASLPMLPEHFPAPPSVGNTRSLDSLRAAYGVQTPASTAIASIREVQEEAQEEESDEEEMDALMAPRKRGETVLSMLTEERK